MAHTHETCARPSVGLMCTEGRLTDYCEYDECINEYCTDLGHCTCKCHSGKTCDCGHTWPRQERVQMSQFDVGELLADTRIPAADRALWSLLYDHAGRLTDLLSLDVRDLDLDTRTVTYDTARKRATDQPAERFGDRSAELLRLVLAESDDAGPLFHSARTGLGLGRETAARRAQQLAGCSIHAFRAAGRRITT